MTQVPAIDPLGPLADAEDQVRHLPSGCGFESEIDVGKLDLAKAVA